MRLKFETVKKLRGHALNAWWRSFGVAAPTDVCNDANLTLLVEFAYRQGFGPRTMFGAVDQVGPMVEKLLEAGLLGASERYWDGASALEYRESGVTIVEQGSVVGRNGILLSPKQGVLETLGGASLSSLFGKSMRPSHLPKPHKIAGNVLVMTRALAQRNYYHWTFEMLAQLRLLEKAAVSFDYVAAPKRHAFATQSLELLGIEPSRILPVGHYTHIQADRLIVPSVGCYFPQPEGVKYLRDRMSGQSWSHYDHSERLKLYVARRRRLSRHIVNEDELFAALKPLGFQKVYLEDLPLQRQIQLFQQADVVAGPHGAGFSNLVYSRPGTAVFEITPTCRPPLFFHYLAEINELHYAVYFGQPVDQQGADANIEVDVAQLRRQLSDFLDEANRSEERAAA
ncbi:glycosyltransferase family 61 protein [Blastopirellula sp. JC732]|uniref:Glycosyltransferase family 61 protein n=1 Tax=Blastopirellula sediminis TaxID=2894196 RepID=A0A9X1MLT1_9BACT|nr:glycosyltransferase family 61 protein [Blastopirellula sediminis]MCC9608971.1 glycosyltransferase family 61 protein [Blastopirellula sediminis]MCC9628252.1 glycosyltransferase family 61 protein [Blastopirellula sediminis]